jgi:hypothetical protein
MSGGSWMSSGAQLLLQLRGAVAELEQLLVGVHESGLVCDVARQLDREGERWRRAIVPRAEPLRRRHGVERRVDLHGVEHAAVQLEAVA